MKSTQLKQLIDLLSPADKAWLELNAPAGSLEKLHDLSDLDNQKPMTSDLSNILQAVKDPDNSDLVFSNHVSTLIESLIRSEEEMDGGFNE